MFYVYLWFREDGTPYYVGKGTGYRGLNGSKHFVKCPVDKSRIAIYNMPDEVTALAYERYFIDFYGRKDLGTGCLRNLTDGGENPPSHKGRPKSAEWRRKMSERCKGSGNPFFGKKHTQEFKQNHSKRFAGELNPFFGQQHTDASREHMRSVR